MAAVGTGAGSISISIFQFSLTGSIRPASWTIAKMYRPNLNTSEIWLMIERQKMNGNEEEFALKSINNASKRGKEEEGREREGARYRERTLD